jgi:holliday junction DNA helicase RuvA
MIGSIAGKVQAQGVDWALVETASGVGYKVFATAEVIARHPVGDDIKLLTHLVVREDQMTLYGFLTLAELGFFVQLISISGVGPRMALSILNAGKVADIKSAVVSNNLAVLTTISGIGAKTAERIMIELRGKVDADINFSDDAQDVLVALSNLGYNSYEVRKILPQLPKNLESVEDKIKHALQLLGK